MELSNLPRQVIHETGDIGRLKVESAADRIAELNPEVKVTTYPFALTAENATEIISNHTIVADGCDHFGTRFIVNRTCLAHHIPLVSAAIAGWQGQLMTIAPHLSLETGCYECFAHPEAPEANTCLESGIIGPLAGIIGSMQALEVVNCILGRPALLGKIARYDARTMEQRVSSLGVDPACPVCSGQ